LSRAFSALLRSSNAPDSGIIDRCAAVPSYDSLSVVASHENHKYPIGAVWIVGQCRINPPEIEMSFADSEGAIQSSTKITEEIEGFVMVVDSRSASPFGPVVVVLRPSV